MERLRRLTAAVLALACGLSGSGKAPPSASSPPSHAALPLSFEPNAGQSDARVDFLARTADGTVFLTGKGATLLFGERGGSRSSAVRLRFEGAAAGRPTGLLPLPGTANYFLGPDRSKWLTGLPTFGSVKYAGVYPGVDVLFYGTARHLEFDFLIEPGADPSQIRLAFEGAEAVSLDERGALRVRIAGNELVQRPPEVYQWDGQARRSIDGHYALDAASRVTFVLGPHDPHRSLLVDPVLAYSTLFGGFNDNYANAVALDAAGNAYVAGFTTATFPTTPGVLQPSFGAGSEAFVAKLNPAGSALSYSTYLGGSGDDVAQAISVDGAGNAVVAGFTHSTDFPTTANAAQRTRGGGRDAFLVKLNAQGSAVTYGTYLGGTGDDAAVGLALDAAGAAYVVGDTTSRNLTTTAGVVQTANAGGTDAFVAKVDLTSGALRYATYLGGTGDDLARAVAVDGAGDAFVAGYTNSTHFPTTAGALKTTGSGIVFEGFVAKLNPTGTALSYGTYLGASGDTYANALTVDGTGNAYVVGSTTAGNFPTTAGVLQPTHAGGADAFVAKLNPAGSALVYATYLGGTGEDNAAGIAVDGAGVAYVGGNTGSPDFPITAAALEPVYAGSNDGFVAKINATGTALTYATFLGGAAGDFVKGIALDGTGQACVAGFSKSPNFPTTAGAFESLTTGGGNAFVAKVDPLGATLTYSTFLGGAADMNAYALAVDPSGSAYLAGGTGAASFPTTVGALQTANLGGFDAFVARVDPSGAALVYSTYLGGSNNDFAHGVAVDAQGNAYVAGFTGSPDFPVTAGAPQATNAAADGGGNNAFVAKLSPQGTALAYSTYLGGSLGDFAEAVAVDSSGSAVVAGYSLSQNFPTRPGAPQPTFGGGTYDAFVAKLNPTGTAFTYATYFGGSGNDFGYGVAVDSTGTAHVVGDTASANLPATAGAAQQAFRGGAFDGFVFAINPSGTALSYCSYLGGASDDYAHGVAVDSSGNAYVTGYTNSTDFPTTAGAFQRTAGGAFDAFVSKLGPTGSLSYSTYLGGADDDIARAIAVDSAGRAHVTGNTSSLDYPTTPDALQKANAGAIDVIVSTLSTDGTALAYSSYLGGQIVDYGYGVGVDSAGSTYVDGYTFSTDFPTTAGALDTVNPGGAYEAFVVRIANVDAGPSSDGGGKADGSVDAGPVDSGAADAGLTGPPPKGCGCASAPSPAWLALALGLALALRRKTRA